MSIESSVRYSDSISIPPIISLQAKTASHLMNECLRGCIDEVKELKY